MSRRAPAQSVYYVIHFEDNTFDVVSSHRCQLINEVAKTAQAHYPHVGWCEGVIKHKGRMNLKSFKLLRSLVR
jgi:hypothetical protein